MKEYTIKVSGEGTKSSIIKSLILLIEDIKELEGSQEIEDATIMAEIIEL